MHPINQDKQILMSTQTVDNRDIRIKNNMNSHEGTRKRTSENVSQQFLSGSLGSKRFWQLGLNILTRSFSSISGIRLTGSESRISVAIAHGPSNFRRVVCLTRKLQLQNHRVPQKGCPSKCCWFRFLLRLLAGWLGGIKEGPQTPQTTEGPEHHHSKQATNTTTTASLPTPPPSHQASLPLPPSQQAQQHHCHHY